jgi:hypothetical protein
MNQSFPNERLDLASEEYLNPPTHYWFSTVTDSDAPPYQPGRKYSGVVQHQQICREQQIK